MASVTLRNVSKMFQPPARVLDAVSLEVADGEFVAILGPSGSGKSTVLRCLAGLEEVSSGEILIGGERVNDLPPADRDVAMVFQSYALYPHLSVRQNLEFPLEMRGIPRTRRAELVVEAARRLEIEPLLERMPGQLSGGQRQRVALGRALVRAPRVFLFDEPLSNLDAALRVQLRTELMALHASLGATMLYVTHDQVEALTMGQRVVVMHEGQVQQVGTPTQVYAEPATAFVARFVGAPGMNLLPLESGEGGLRAGDLVFEGAPAGATPAQVGIRPEHLRLSPAGGAGAEAVVTAVERLGSETLVHLRLPSGQALVARVPGLDPVGTGDRVGISLPSGSLHWFDATGRRC